MCKHITPLDTKTHFVILMHPKEFRKTKNGTGHFTHLSLKNSELYVGIDFSQNEKINYLLKKYTCYVLYPSDTSINLDTNTLEQRGKDVVIFLIDSTWPCSRAMLRASPNLDTLPKVSFTNTKSSSFTFKEQPQEYCLSTMESTLCVLELLTQQKIENIETKSLKNFLSPFYKMVEYQLSCNL